MRVTGSSGFRAVLLVSLLLVQVTALGIHSTDELESKTNPMMTNNTLTDNGDGTWNVTYAVDMDATLDSRSPTNPLGSTSYLEVGWNANQQDIRNSLLGFDLSSAGFPLNATIESATLQVHLASSTGSVDTQAWNIHLQGWEIQYASWVNRNGASQWYQGGALGNSDSGAKQDQQRVEGNSGEVRFDICLLYTSPSPRDRG